MQQSSNTQWVSINRRDLKHLQSLLARISHSQTRLKKFKIRASYNDLDVTVLHLFANAVFYHHNALYIRQCLNQSLFH